MRAGTGRAGQGQLVDAAGQQQPQRGGDGPFIFFVTRSRQHGQCKEWKHGMVKPMPDRPMTQRFLNPSIHSYA
jgi:hypothetical protein